MLLTRKFALLLLSFTLLSASVACGGDDDDKPGAVSTTTTRVIAADGANISDPDNKVLLSISAGALSEDTDISLSVHKATSQTVSEIFDFGPDGLTFQHPVLLQIKVDPAKVAGKQVTIGLKTGNKFEPVAGSSYNNGVVTAPITHFSSFTVVFVDGVAQDTGCDADVAAFTACGGDLTGTWTLQNFCFAGITNGHPECPDYSASLTINFDGVTFTFGGDNSFQSSAGTRTFTETYHVPLSCLDGGNATSCETADVNPDAVCGSNAGICICVVEESEPSPPESGTYTTTDSTVQITKDGEADDAVEYCVQGNTLYVLENGPKGTQKALLTLQRR